MSLRLVIESGPASPLTQPIQEVVSRIGSGRHMTLRIAGLPDWAFTLVQEADGYAVINRGNAPLQLGEEWIEIDQRAHWLVGIPLHCQETVLRLDSQDSQRRFADHEVREDQESCAAPVSYSGPKRLKGICALIVMVGVAFGYNAFWGNGNTIVERDQRRADELFSRLMWEVRRTPIAAIERWNSLAHRAWLAELMRDRQEAMSVYVKLREQLDSVLSSAEENSDARHLKQVAKEINRFVNIRLGVLGQP